jgi:hypothetical protein
LDLGPHPYQGSAAGSFPQDGTCDLGEQWTAGDRWRPLGTARLRWHVDQTWTRHARSRGQRRSASRALAGKETPAGCPRQVSPARAIALLGGALAGSGPGTSPNIGGLSLVTGMVVPQHAACSNHADDGGCLDDMGPRGRSVVVSRSWCAAAGAVGFEAASTRGIGRGPGAKVLPPAGPSYLSCPLVPAGDQTFPRWCGPNADR